MIDMTNAYLIHGTSTRDDDWFPWLETAAAPQIQLNRLWLPAPFNPERQAWDQAVDDQIPVQDGLTAVRFVARHDLHDVRLLLVGAFDRPLPQYPTLTDFILPRPDYTRVRPKVSQATVIVAKDDPIAPYRQGIAMASDLEAKLIVQETGGHFLTSDGFRKFPLALTELDRLSK